MYCFIRWKRNLILSRPVISIEAEQVLIVLANHLPKEKSHLRRTVFHQFEISQSRFTVLRKRLQELLRNDGPKWVDCNSNNVLGSLNTTLVVILTRLKFYQLCEQSLAEERSHSTKQFVPSVWDPSVAYGSNSQLKFHLLLRDDSPSGIVRFFSRSWFQHTIKTICSFWMTGKLELWDSSFEPVKTNI